MWGGLVVGVLVDEQFVEDGLVEKAAVGRCCAAVELVGVFQEGE
jgi:hypothetical protein